MAKGEMSRRTFVTAAGAAAAAGMLAGCGAAGNVGFTGVTAPSTIADMSIDHFTGFEGREFDVIHLDEGIHGTVRLEQVIDYTDVAKYPPEVDFRTPFVAIFRTEDTYLPGEGMYEVTHPEFGPFDLHMIPRQPDEEGAIFDITMT